MDQRKVKWIVDSKLIKASLVSVDPSKEGTSPRHGLKRQIRGREG